MKKSSNLLRDSNLYHKKPAFEAGTEIGGLQTSIIVFTKRNQQLELLWTWIEDGNERTNTWCTSESRKMFKLQFINLKMN